jgi:hypothetical protein
MHHLLVVIAMMRNEDKADARDAGLYKEAWPLIVARLGSNTGSLSESLIGKEQNSSCAHIKFNIWFTMTQSLPRLLLYIKFFLLTRLYFGIGVASSGPRGTNLFVQIQILHVHFYYCSRVRIWSILARKKICHTNM